MIKHNNNREKKMSDQIQKDLMHIFKNKLKDPRIEWVTVTEVMVSPDYSVAKIYYTVLNLATKVQVAQALESARGFIRSSLAQGFSSYTIPQLKFIYDQSLEQGTKVLSLLNKITDEQE